MQITVGNFAIWAHITPEEESEEEGEKNER